MTLKIRNWDRWQSYRKDRGQPPWIKIHRRLMRHPSWVSLSDAQRGQLVAIWMLAADQHGVIPASASLIRKLCFMDSDPDLNLFIESDFIERGQHDAISTPERRQHDPPEEKRIEEKRIEEKRVIVRQEPDGFSEFYLSYPKKQARKKAAKAYAAARREVSHETIMAGLDRAKRTDRRFLDFQYTPQPASWLNAGGWADETNSRQSPQTGNFL